MSYVGSWPGFQSPEQSGHDGEDGRGWMPGHSPSPGSCRAGAEGHRGAVSETQGCRLAVESRPCVAGRWQLGPKGGQRHADSCAGWHQVQTPHAGHSQGPGADGAGSTMTMGSAGPAGPLMVSRTPLGSRLLFSALVFWERRPQPAASGGMSQSQLPADHTAKAPQPPLLWSDWGAPAPSKAPACCTTSYGVC